MLTSLEEMQIVATFPPPRAEDCAADPWIAAIEALARDYPGRIADLQSQQGFGETMAQTPMPRGRVAGSASNPFSVYIGANPLESAAAGAQQFMGHRERRKAMEGRQ